MAGDLMSTLRFQPQFDHILDLDHILNLIVLALAITV